jgi:pyrophosphate--fructose-6-phosphate 1-phosphotransferase
VLSPLQKARIQYIPQMPEILRDVAAITFAEGADFCPSELFPKLSSSKLLRATKQERESFPPLRVGVVLSGGQAPGGHNVITGLYDALHVLNPNSRLFGFIGGPGGILKDKVIEFTAEHLLPYRNQGGFDLIGSGRTKIETQDQFQQALETVEGLNLDGLVIVGGDDSNTNACFLAEYFLQHSCKTTVVGVPKTIDGDLQNEFIEISFGFDTACRVYSEIIGNIARDALSAKKYYFFIKLMGRSTSHITLECALATHPNLALIGEEIHAKGESLADVVREICDLIAARAEEGKDYGVILIPEGVIEFIDDVKILIAELNAILASESPHSASLESMIPPEKVRYVIPLLADHAKRTFELLPPAIQEQLLCDRDPHGNVQVSKIESERLFIELCGQELSSRKLRGEYKGSFSPVPIFCGYEGRSALPSTFDANYCYSLGRLAACLVARKKTGYMTVISSLAKHAPEWAPGAAPLHMMIHFEERDGKQKAVIRKAPCDLHGRAFEYFAAERDGWRVEDCYCQSGPMQFFGPEEFSDSRPLSLELREKK